jgi:hypothetical protein
MPEQQQGLPLYNIYPRMNEAWLARLHVMPLV